MVSGCCGAGWKPAGSSGRELSLSCTIPGSLLGLVPSSASVMRWHSSPSRDALEVSVCLRKKKKKLKKAATPGKSCRGIIAKVALGTSGQGGREGSPGCSVDYLKGAPCWTLSELQDGAFPDFLLIPTRIWGSSDTTFSSVTSTVPQPLSCRFYCCCRSSAALEPWIFSGHCTRSIWLQLDTPHCQVSCPTKIKAPRLRDKQGKKLTPGISG